MSLLTSAATGSLWLVGQAEVAEAFEQVERGAQARHRLERALQRLERVARCEDRQSALPNPSHDAPGVLERLGLGVGLHAGEGRLGMLQKVAANPDSGGDSRRRDGRLAEVVGRFDVAVCQR